MVGVAVLGYGVVGSGVAEVIDKNARSIAARAGQQVYVRHILDIRKFENDPYQNLLTDSAESVFSDPEVKVVVETIGGAKIAYDFTKRALMSGRHVITSNKELVAAHGPELLQLAADHHVHYLFEASVGGGIPVIRPLHHCLAANEIESVEGILNGTTNYILTSMKNDAKDFDVALSEAQNKGYAEADPSADVDGHDACRKIAILSSIAYRQYVDFRKIPTEGIRNISLTDIRIACDMGYAVKLVGRSSIRDGKVSAQVSPMLVHQFHPLANVDDVFNAVVINGDAVGETMFYGRGAGKLPTASAVVADIVDAVQHMEGGSRAAVWKTAEDDCFADPQDYQTRFLLRVCGSVPEALMAEHQLGYQKVTSASIPVGESVILTDMTTEAAFAAFLTAAISAGTEIISTIRAGEAR